MNIPADAERPSRLKLLFEPNISLNGLIAEESTLPFFLERLAAVRSSGEDIILELNTAGGDADAACRIALEIRLFIRHSGRQAYCVGKTVIYSAGVSIFAAFPKSCRFLTEDAVLLVLSTAEEKPATGRRNSLPPRGSVTAAGRGARLGMRALRIAGVCQGALA